MPTPAKAGSPLHKKRISEGLKEYHRGKGKKSKKSNLLMRWWKSRNHPDNVRHRKMLNDPELKKARKELRKAEGDMSAGGSGLTQEQRLAIRERIRKAKEREDKAYSQAHNKHRSLV